jgi:hypothetical protein
MKLHPTVIEKLISLCSTYGGHRNDVKLRSMFSELDLSAYERQNTGEKVLVLTEQLNNEKEQLKGSR